MEGGNSLKERAEKEELAKMTKPGEGSGVIRKKSWLSRSFFAADAADVKSYLIEDLIIPKIKETVLSTLYMMFYKDTSGYPGRAGSGSSRMFSGVRGGQLQASTDYHSISSGRRELYSDTVRNRRSDMFGDIEYRKSNNPNENLESAKNDLSTLEDLILQYDKVRVAEAYQICTSVSPNSTDWDWGWKNLDDARLIPMIDGIGWILRLPAPISMPKK